MRVVRDWDERAAHDRLGKLGVASFAFVRLACSSQGARRSHGERLFLWPRLVVLAFLLHTGVAQTVGPNHNLTRAPGNQYETTVAINPAAPNQVFVAARNESGGLYTARSTDGGATWTTQWIARSSTPPVGDIPRAYGNPSAAWDSYGNLFLAYLSQGSSTAGTYACLAVSKDGGATFSSPLFLSPKIADQPTVAIGASSVWMTYWTDGGIVVAGARVSGPGSVGAFTTWQPPQRPSVNFGDIAVGPKGEVMVAYGPNTGSTGTIYINTKLDGLGPGPFSNFSAVVPVNMGGFTPIPAQPNWGVDPEAGLAWDLRRNRVYMVYTDAPAPGSADTNIFVIHSDDTGATWSRPVRVNDDTGTNSQFLPHISVDPSSGAVAVTWYDARGSALNNTARYYGAFSTDGGVTFAPNFAISAGISDASKSPAVLKKTDYGDYTASVVANGRLVAAWADNSNSTGDNPDTATSFDVYAASVSAPAAAQPVIFDFDTGTPALALRQNVPIDQAVSGISAHFSSPAGPAFSIQSDALARMHLSQFARNYLYANNSNGSALDIQFSRPLSAISFTFATTDFQQVEVPTTIQLTASLDSTPAGTATAHGAYGSDTLPMGQLSFSSTPFNFVEISIPRQAAAAGAFFVDNIKVTPAALPAFSNLSAASYANGAPLAPDSIASGFGQNLAFATESAASEPPPTTLANTTVTVKDSAGVERPSGLFYVGPSQINYLVPSGLASGPATVTVTSNGQVTASGAITLDTVAPGIFTANFQGTGPPAAAAISFAPGSAQTVQPVASCPTGPGSCVPAPIDLGPDGTTVVLTLYGTGIRGRAALTDVNATIGGIAAQVLYAGAQPQFAGLDQVNIVIPRALAGRGEADLALTIAGRTANPVRLNIAR